MADIDTLDRMRRALGECTFLPGISHKRFARQVAAMRLEAISEKQWRHVIRLAWRYRRQMPPDLVPSKDAVEACDRGPAGSVLGIALPIPERAPGQPARERKIKPTPEAPPLVGMMEGKPSA
jgi:hypothetical protein